MSQLNRVRFVLGDYFYIHTGNYRIFVRESNLTRDQLWDAYLKACETSGVDFHTESGIYNDPEGLHLVVSKNVSTKLIKYGMSNNFLTAPRECHELPVAMSVLLEFILLSCPEGTIIQEAYYKDSELEDEDIIPNFSEIYSFGLGLSQ